MAFKFSLATVLRVREIAEKREERMLQQIQHEISNTHLAIADAADEATMLGNSRQAHIHQVMNANCIRASYDELALVQQKHSGLCERLAKLESLKANQAGVYHAARRDREMLTSMRGDMQTIYEAELTKRDQRTVDDNYIARRMRSNS